MIRGNRTDVGGLTTVRTVGGLVPADLLGRIIAGTDLPGLSADDYRLELGVSPREAANRAWSVLTGAWTAYRTALATRPPGDRATALTRDKWLAVLLRELGFGRVPPTPAGGLHADERAFPVSHLWGDVPIHLLGWDVDLDRRTPGVAGAAERAPHAMVQELLNRSDDHLWAMLANGGILRLLRDSSSLVGQSYVEFDLEAMFDGEVFSDFAVLYLVCHQTRFEPVDSEAGPEDCWLERWRTDAVETGARALGALRIGVQRALQALGTGFLQHPANTDLRQRIDGDLDLADYHRALLRLVYRLLFCFVSEDRGLLLDPAADSAAKQRFGEWFSTGRLRRIATRRRGTRHADLWQALSLVIDGLGHEGGQPALGLPGIGGLFEDGPADVVTGSQLGNDALLAALRHLCVIQPTGGGPKRTVDYRNLGAEELGGIYESLLEFVPRYDRVRRQFTLESLVGNERKTSGAYYTPTSLIDCLLDSALDPLLHEAEAANDPEAALLALTVCDPACGSGHFLVAAARRIAARVARVRADGEPTLLDSQVAMHDVVGTCIYGVDLNPMAAELAKVSLWLEALQPGRPLSFLDAHIKVGNALLGTTPALLSQGIPDEAYTALDGDDKKVVVSLRKRNKADRDHGVQELLASAGISVDNRTFADEARAIDASAGLSLADIHLVQRRQRELDESPALRRAKLVADAWCVAFVIRKGPTDPAITHDVLRRWQSIDHRQIEFDPARTEVQRLAAQYRFFHWHLEFPLIFQVPESRSTGTEAGWEGGFSCVLGNPPWETLSPDTREFFGGLVPDIRGFSKAEKDMRIAELLKHEVYRLRWERHQHDLFATAHFLKRSGRYRMYAQGNLGKGDFNVYRSFAELALSVTAIGGFAGQIIQSGLYAGANASAIRKALIDECTWTTVYGFDNKGGSWFEGVSLENFAAYTARVGYPSPPGHAVSAAFGLPDPRTIRADLAMRSLSITIADIRAQNPETLAIPDIRDPRSARIAKRLYGCWPPFGELIPNEPYRDFSREIDMSDKNDVFTGEPDGIPIYEGRMVDFFDHRAKRYVSGHGNRSVWEETSFGSERKIICPQWYVNDTDLQNDAVRDRIRQFRVGFMDIADPGRQRSFVSAIVPPGTVCGHTVPTLTFPNAEWFMPICLAIANSMVVDFLARQRATSKHMTFNILDSLPLARLTRDDPRSMWLGRRALLLSCTSPEMVPFWNQMAQEGWVDRVPDGVIPGEGDAARRVELRADVDAYVARHVYKLTRDELKLIIDTFTQLAGIEEKRDGEFRTKRLVLGAYDRLTAP